MNETIQKAISFVNDVLNDALRGGQRVCCSISGGADSDILIDLCEKTVPHFVNYVFFDTMIEYQATKEHLCYLEEKYGIEIHREKAKCPVPLSSKRYGVPFLSKHISEMIYRLQKHNFNWEDDSFENLIKKYPKCKSALKWWTNEGDSKWFGIQRNVWLKEYMVKNPPQFKISPKCCEGAKKNPAADYVKTHKVDLMITGIRQSEGGIRATAYKEPYYFNKHLNCISFMPILFFTDSDRKEYENIFNIVHSDCYTKYGLLRTGCVGCLYGKDYMFERNIAKQYEPKLSKAIENMWKEVYEYQDKYHEFQKIMNRKYKEKKKCVCGCTEFTGDDVAMNLKYFGRDVKTLLCRGCFQNITEMTDKEWNEAIEGFKAQGCELF